ncbi:hypothetical protein [Sedimentitalea todarodis]|uniref:Uncharacterized protein n=1 Tax=Sedimentitalea todarodis TaxID=1631240 RepID=A0ABU3VE68_9RHOB|nr:hypothetical protein [Sedimentitalea todarodis]MDU9004451.1 hypothetical protein [Sedimentitalea todarodis]
MTTSFAAPAFVPFDARYPGVSPQLLARTRQMWSAGRLDLDEVWHKTIGRFRGSQTIGNWNLAADSGPIDQFLMFEQAAIWVASLNATAAMAVDRPHTMLTNPQWRALHALTFRMIEQLDAIRLLFLTGLPTPSLQIARSISEDIDMALAFVSRPKLAARFIDCATIEEANEFWRRHIAGGRAFKAVSEQLYRAGLEFDQSGEYAAWRKNVKAILGTAVHSAYRSPEPMGALRSAGPDRKTSDCLYFVTLRLQEMCAYSHVLTKDFGEDLEAIRHARQPNSEDDLGCLTARISKITVEQLRWTLATGDVQDVAVSPQLH